MTPPHYDFIGGPLDGESKPLPDAHLLMRWHDIILNVWGTRWPKYSATGPFYAKIEQTVTLKLAYVYRLDDGKYRFLNAEKAA